jgi:murein endopeptidase
VLARLRDRPVRWTLTRPHPDEPPPHTRSHRTADARACLMHCATLFAILGLASSISEADQPDLGDQRPRRPGQSRPTSDPALRSICPRSQLHPRRPTPARRLPTIARHESPPPPPTIYITEPPTFELPADAIGLGRPTDGAILHALQLPSSPDYTIRCPALAHATTATINELMHALARARNHGYTGELVVGDLSRLDGGRYGPHKSHQSGRDVDLWLPIRGGRYDRGCPRCGTDLCRPEPEQVDWPATWTLIQSLAERGTIEDIFLDWTLHPALAQAAHDLNVPPDEIHRQIQHPIRGRSTLIKHSDGHIHHLHVRFREPPPA